MAHDHGTAGDVVGRKGILLQSTLVGSGVAHIIWAEIFRLVTTNVKRWQVMTDEVTEAIDNAKLRWNTLSLKSICGGLAQGFEPILSTSMSDFDYGSAQVNDGRTWLYHDFSTSQAA